MYTDCRKVAAEHGEQGGAGSGPSPNPCAQEPLCLPRSLGHNFPNPLKHFESAMGAGGSASGQACSSPLVAWHSSVKARELSTSAAGLALVV